MESKEILSEVKEWIEAHEVNLDGIYFVNADWLRRKIQDIKKDMEKAKKENKIVVTHIPYSKSIRITYETQEEAERVLSILAKNGINGNSRKYTG